MNKKKQNILYNPSFSHPSLLGWISGWTLITSNCLQLYEKLVQRVSLQDDEGPTWYPTFFFVKGQMHSFFWGGGKYVGVMTSFFFFSFSVIKTIIRHSSSSHHHGLTAGAYLVRCCVQTVSANSGIHSLLSSQQCYYLHWTCLAGSR